MLLDTSATHWRHLGSAAALPVKLLKKSHSHQHKINQNGTTNPLVDPGGGGARDEYPSQFRQKSPQITRFTRNPLVGVPRLDNPGSTTGISLSLF